MASPRARSSTSPGFKSARRNVDLGWVLDPLSAVMLVMVSFVGLLIFIYSIGYMKHDENYTRFFCFMSLFAGAMLGVVIANSLLLLFMCWELVGLTSYLLIGFWYQKPAAAAAAKKAFSPRASAMFSFCLELSGCSRRPARCSSITTARVPWRLAHWPCIAGAACRHLGLSAAGAIGLLIFAGAAGKSGQFPLHVWLPDAMEGPTPVSALIHAATMVAAGVYLIARVYPLMQAGRACRRNDDGADGRHLGGRIDGRLCRADCRRAERHQAHPGLLDRLATGLHDGRPGHGRRCRGNVPPDHSCLLQGALVHGRGLGDSRLPRGAGYPAHGRAEVRHAADLRDLWDRNAGAVRLSAACSPASGARTAFWRRRSTGAWRKRRSTCWSLARC